MKFCDERIQKHLLSGGKIKRRDLNIVISIDKNKKLCYGKFFSSIYILTENDLLYNGWEIAEPEYNWSRIIKDKVLCIFSDDENFDSAIISTLKGKDESYFYDARSIWFMYCKPIKASDYNIINNLKEYEL